MATANPAMNPAVYQRAFQAGATTNVMTMQGAITKTAFLLLILITAAIYGWTQVLSGPSMNTAILLGAFIGGTVVAFITIFFPRASPITAPLYAGLEGIALGAISAVMESRYHGLVVNAVGLSVSILAIMLFLYGVGLIQATEKFKIGVVAATGAICLVYVVDIVASFFGTRLPFIHDSGMLGIGFSLAVVVIAALNLVLDFDFIEQGVRRQAPKFMEWYGGFSLLVTLVWMYLEILRLLAKMQGSRD
jgi:uncharacterized YccA/Bax inhibitor family protein